MRPVLTSDMKFKRHDMWADYSMWKIFTGKRHSHAPATDRLTAKFFSLLPVRTSCMRFGMDSAWQISHIEAYTSMR